MRRRTRWAAEKTHAPEKRERERERECAVGRHAPDGCGVDEEDRGEESERDRKACVMD